MAFTKGITQLKKRFYNVYLDMKNNDYINKLIDNAKIHKMLKDNIDNLNETHLTDGATVGNDSGLYVYTGNDTINVTVPASNNNSGIRFIAELSETGIININSNTISAEAFEVAILKDYSNNDNEKLECSLLPLGAVLEGLTAVDGKGDERALASGNTLVVSNTVSVNFTLAGFADELQGLIKNINNNVGLLFIDRFGDNHFYIDDLNPFTSLNIVSNDIGQTEFTVEDERGLKFIQMLEE